MALKAETSVEASPGNICPMARASKIRISTPGKSDMVWIGGNVIEIGRSRRGGIILSMTSRSATVSPPLANLIALAVTALASASRSASQATVVLFRAPRGRPGLPDAKGRPPLRRGVVASFLHDSVAIVGFAVHRCKAPPFYRYEKPRAAVAGRSIEIFDRTGRKSFSGHRPEPELHWQDSLSVFSCVTQ